MEFHLIFAWWNIIFGIPSRIPKAVPDSPHYASIIYIFVSELKHNTQTVIIVPYTYIKNLSEIKPFLVTNFGCEKTYMDVKNSLHVHWSYIILLLIVLLSAINISVKLSTGESGHSNDVFYGINVKDKNSMVSFDESIQKLNSYHRWSRYDSISGSKWNMPP